MIKLPYNYAIHHRDRTRLMGGSWDVRVMYYDARMNKHEAFIMAKNSNWLERIGPQYAARLYGSATWVAFETEEEMCIAMCAKHRMSIR